LTLGLRSQERKKISEYIACSTRGPFGAGSAPGLVVKAQGKMGYVMLDVFGSSAQFKQRWSAGEED
jgi:hypothetical protein